MFYACSKMLCIFQINNSGSIVKTQVNYLTFDLITSNKRINTRNVSLSSVAVWKGWANYFYPRVLGIYGLYWLYYITFNNSP